MLAKTKTILIDPQIMTYWKDLLKCQENSAEILGVSSEDWKLSLSSSQFLFSLYRHKIPVALSISFHTYSNNNSFKWLFLSLSKVPFLYWQLSFMFLSTISIYFYMIWQSNTQIKFNFSRKIIWKAQCMLWVKSTLCQISILRQSVMSRKLGVYSTNIVGLPEYVELKKFLRKKYIG